MKKILVVLFFIPFPLLAQKDTIFFNDYSAPENNIVFTTNWQADFIQYDFSEFESLLGEYNTGLMNRSVGRFDLEISSYIKKLVAGFHVGTGYSSDNDHDSLDIEFNTFNAGLIFGYKLLETKRFIITPKLDVKWNRYRLINSDNQSKIPVQQYLDDRELDMRFNQVTAGAKLVLGYKIYSLSPFFGTYDYMSIGIYGGYLVPLNQRPWVYSLKNRLMTDSEIKTNHLNLGISFTMYLDHQ